MRDRTGAQHAFYNVYRHRGHELLQGQGNIKSIVCPYHAWSLYLEAVIRDNN